MQKKEVEYFSDDPGFPVKTVVGILFIGAFLGYLNETLLNVALSTLMREFGVEKNTVQWVTTGFLLVMGAVTPMSAVIMQWFRTRVMVLMTLGIFLAGSLICALAPSFPVLLAGRLVQAVAAAFSLPLLMNAILVIFPPGRRGRAMSLVSVIFTVAPAVGPTLSGVVVDHLGWRYLFVLTLPWVLLAMLLAATRLKVDLMPVTRPRLDVLSALLSVVGFGALVYAASQFAQMSGLVFAAVLALAFVGIAWFVRRQLRLAEPVLDMRAFAVPQFRCAVALFVVGIFLFLGLELLLPMYAQQVLMLSGTVTGLMLLPASVAEAALAPVFGLLLDKRGGRWVAWPGGVAMVGGATLLWWYASASSQAVVLGGVFGVFAVGVAGAVAGQTHGLNCLPKRLQTHGTAIFGTVMPVGGALGAAFFVGMTQWGEARSAYAAQQAAMLEGVQLALGCGAAVSLLALLAASRFAGGSPERFPDRAGCSASPGAGGPDA